MREQLIGFIDALRQAGLTPSLSESLDAAAAVATSGIERPVLRAVLAATLIKDHADRATFDDVFDRYFALPPRPAGVSQRPHPRGEGAGGGRGAPSPAAQSGLARSAPDAGRSGRPGEERERAPAAPSAQDPSPQVDDQRNQSARELARRRALLAQPFRGMDPRDVDALRALVAELGRRLRVRWSRRIGRAVRGRVDLRRTIRRSLSRGGVPIELIMRAPRPGKADLVALVDLSYSTATAAEFLLAVLAPARRFFRRVTLLAFVDRPCPVSFEGGHVVPHEAIDLNARSDFGNVLVRLAERSDVMLGRNTVLLILGDARNNRRPPRSEQLRTLHRHVRSVVWLNPEPPERWNTGDSVMASYERHCDALLAAWSPQTLGAALDELARVAL